MSRKKIEAGEAYVGLGVRDQMAAGLNLAKARLKSFGVATAKIGGALSAAGSSITGSFLTAAKVFASVGDSLDEMSSRTGMGIETLSQLAFAAGRSGASIESIELAARGMAKTILAFSQGGSSAVETMNMLGVSLDDIQGKTPDQQFVLLAEAVSKIQDPTTRAALAMKVFGKSGTQILPMISGGAAGLAEMAKESDRLGLTMSKESAQSAAELADAFDDLKSGIKGMIINVGAAVAGPLTAIFKIVSNITASVIGWIKSNQELLTVFAAVGAAVSVIGTALVALGSAAIVLPPIVGGIASAFAGLGAVLAVITSPIGLLVAGLGAAVIAFLTLTETGKNVVNWFLGNFGKLYEHVTGTISGISDALQAGDMALAAKIGFTAVKLSIATILEAIESMFGVSFEGMFRVVAELARAIGSVIANLNISRQKVTNWLAEIIGKIVLDEQAQRLLGDVNKQALKDANQFAVTVAAFDAAKFGSDLHDSLDPTALSAELEGLKRQAKESKDAVLKGPELATGLSNIIPDFGQELATAAQTAKTSFTNFAGLRGSFAARGGPGAKSIEDKMLKESQKQTKVLEDINDNIEDGGAVFS